MMAPSELVRFDFHRQQLRATLIEMFQFSVCVFFLSITPSAYADGWLSHPPEPVCIDVASMKANDFITEGMKPNGLLWHGTRCYSVTVGEPSRCDWKTSITEDRELGSGRRLLIATSHQVNGHSSRDLVLVFKCEDSRLRPVLRANYSEGVKAQVISADQLAFTARDSTDTGYPPDRERRDVFKWNPAEDRYGYEGATIWSLPRAMAIPTPNTGAPPFVDPGHVAEADCDDLPTLSASNVISYASSALRYGDYAQGVGCDANDYGEGHPVCDWKTELDEDRMLGQTRRLIVATSIHMTGSGSWNAVMVFGCKENHVVTLFADQALALAVDTADTSALKLAYGDKLLLYKWNADRGKYDFVGGRVVPGYHYVAPSVTAYRKREAVQKRSQPPYFGFSRPIIPESPNR